MSHKDPHSKKVVDYLDGNLSPNEAQDFEKTIREDQEVQDEVALTSRVIKAIQGHAFKEMLKKIHQEKFGTPGENISSNGPK